MKLNDKTSLTGELFVFKNHELEQHIKNLVVDTGKRWAAQRIGGSTSPAPKDMGYMGIGEGSRAPTVADTALEVELARYKSGNTNVTDNKVIFTCTLPAGVGTGAVTEAGIFDEISGGNMLSRSVFPVVNKQVDDFVTILWLITVV